MQALNGDAAIEPHVAGTWDGLCRAKRQRGRRGARMRIGLNLLYLLPGEVGGTETYAAGLLRGFAKVASDHSFYVLVNQEARNWPLPASSSLTRVVCPVGGNRRGLRYLYEQSIFARLLRKLDLDLVHSLGYVGPVWAPCPSIVTIPDLNYVVLKSTIRAERRLVLRAFSGLAARRSARIITISEYSKKQIAQYWKVAPSKIRVTHLGGGWVEDHAPRTRRAREGEMMELPRPYIAAFGGGSDHKNIERLVEAFSLASSLLPHSLVLIGRISEGAKRAVGRLDAAVRARTISVGHVPASDIQPLLSTAEFFILPSLYEGFGLPLIEAQLSGTPVACSNAGSLPEVAGGSTLLFDPESTEDIRRALLVMAGNSSLRDELREKGQRNVQRFSWTKTARETLRVYHEVVDHSI